MPCARQSADRSRRQAADDRRGRSTVPRPHQAGITTPAQDRLHFAAFDVTTTSRDELIALLKEWTAAAALMTAGRDIGPVRRGRTGSDEAPPDDTGEAIGLPPARLTITFGFGPSLFDGRTGSVSPRNARRRWSTCRTSSATTSTRRARTATSASRPAPTIRRSRCTRSATWRGSGSGGSPCGGRSSDSAVRRRRRRRSRRRATCSGSRTARTTSRLEDADKLEQHVWVQPEDGPDWMVGGSYLVARRIRMNIETWDRTSLGEQEGIIGRTKGTGAPLGGTRVRRARLQRQAGGRPTADPGRLPRPPRPPRPQQGRRTAAPRLQLRRRLRRTRPPRRRPVLPRLPARPAQTVHPGAEPTRQERHDERVPPPRRLRHLRLPTRRNPRRLLGREALHLTS